MAANRVYFGFGCKHGRDHRTHTKMTPCFICAQSVVHRRSFVRSLCILWQVNFHKIEAETTRVTEQSHIIHAETALRCVFCCWSVVPSDRRAETKCHLFALLCVWVWVWKSSVTSARVVHHFHLKSPFKATNKTNEREKECEWERKRKRWTLIVEDEIVQPASIVWLFGYVICALCICLLRIVRFVIVSFFFHFYCLIFVLFFFLLLCGYYDAVAAIFVSTFDRIC